MYILVAGAYLNPPLIAVCFSDESAGLKFILSNLELGIMEIL